MMTELPVYFETVYRYVVERKTELPEEHKAEYRLKGVDPEQLWDLVWSFQTYEAAKLQLERELKKGSKIFTWRMRDLGETKQIKRYAY